MNPSKESGKESSRQETDKEKLTGKTKSDQQKSDPPLTEIKGVTHPEEYVEPKVEKEPEK